MILSCSPTSPTSERSIPPTTKMAAYTQQRGGFGSKLDTSYISFESEKSVRSPRTPTYVPDSPLATSILPFDHTKLFNESAPEAQDKPSFPPPPSEKPMSWIWICHLCHSRYAIGVTRRCLVDGHYYCSGESDKPSIRKKKKHKACSSEFDYASWKLWGDWRRKVVRKIHNDRVIRGCEYCDFPSQCRYPVDTHPLGNLGTVSSSKSSLSVPHQEVKAATAVVEQGKARTTSTANECVDFDQILKNIFPDADVGQPDLDEPTTTKQKKGGSKKRQTGNQTLAPILELSLSGDDGTLHSLADMDWSHFEDIEMGKPKID
jgi:hypothetical protein